MENDDIKPDMDTLLGGPLGPGRVIALSDGTMLFVPENVQLTAEEISALHHPAE